jgi:hypothetical protein
MAKLTQKEIINQQSQSISIITNRLVEIELLLASITDLITEKGVIDRNDLEMIIKQKAQLLNDRVRKFTESKEKEVFEYFPYYGEPGEA